MSAPVDDARRAAAEDFLSMWDDRMREEAVALILASDTDDRDEWEQIANSVHDREHGLQ